MRLLLFICLITCVTLTAMGQSNVRKQLDSERNGSFLDDKTYEKARGFIRRDSTYYLGYLLEGAYLFYRANDELGFNKAIPPLQKALDKIENDYDRQLRTRTNNYQVYSANYRFHFDYGLISYFLSRCYQNVEMQDKAMDVLKHIRDRNFQVEVNMDSYNTMAWIFHRNRVYTSSRFSFLKNSVKDNVHAANLCLDSALRKIQVDFAVNNGLYDPQFLNRQYLSTFHYKAMIYDYLLNIDSANYYYDILIQNNAYSSNNYAEFKLAMGEFEEAEMFFREAEERATDNEKNTKEYYYMRGSLAIYRGHPEQADTLLTRVLQNQGSTPGYGWHSIGLARAQHYEGLTAESQEHTNKASRFQELHIGTTWGAEQYNMAVASLNYINQLQFKKEYWFEHHEWYFWLNPLNWYRWVKYTLAVRHHKMVLASLVAENPEREQVIYSLFSPENLVTFDEVWSVIEGFGNEYFIDIYKKRLNTDKRPALTKYYHYVLGKLYLAEGNEAEAMRYFNKALIETNMEDTYQTLLAARIFEGLALASKGADQKKYIQLLYNTYPQLVPFTDLTMAFRLNVPGTLTEVQQDLMDELRSAKIEFTEGSNVPVVTLTFVPQGQALEVGYSVKAGDAIVQQGSLTIEANERKNAGKLVAYRLFGIQKTKIGDTPTSTTPQPVIEKGDKPV